MPKPKEIITVNIEPAARKRNPPKTAYSKENPSPHAFQPGVSPNPGGRAGSKPRLLSRALKARLDCRAPDAVAASLKVPRGSSWATVLAQALVVQAIKGDVSASRMIAEYSEGPPAQKLAFGFGDGEEGGGHGGPALQIVFVSPEMKAAAERTGAGPLTTTTGRREYLPPGD